MTAVFIMSRTEIASLCLLPVGSRMSSGRYRMALVARDNQLVTFE